MAAQVISFFRSITRRASDWSQQELAEFYRVQAALGHAGLRVETDRGLTDEGDPWFVFCREDDGEVVIHFARVGDEYVMASSAFDGVARAHDFSTLVRDLIDRHPLIQPPRRPSSKVLIHPAAMLVAIVATALLKTGDAQAHSDAAPTAAQDDDAARDRSGSGLRLSVAATSQSKPTPSIADAAQAATILSAISYAAHQAAGDALLAGEAAGPAQGSSGTIFAPFLNAVVSGTSRALSAFNASSHSAEGFTAQAPIASLSLAEQREASQIVNALMALPQAPMAGLDWRAFGQAAVDAGAVAFPQSTLPVSATALERPAPPLEEQTPSSHALEGAARSQARSDAVVNDSRPHDAAKPSGLASTPPTPVPPEASPVGMSAFSARPSASSSPSLAELNSTPTAQAAQGGHGVILDLLNTAVSHGVQIAIGNGSPPPSDSSARSQTPRADDRPSLAEGSGSSSDAAREPGLTVIAVKQSPSPPQPSSELATSPTGEPPSAAGDQASIPKSFTPEQVQAAITRFCQAQLDVEHINVGRDVIYYDPDALDGHPNAVGSVNLVFADGSRISLIGFQQDIDAAV